MNSKKLATIYKQLPIKFSKLGCTGSKEEIHVTNRRYIIWRQRDISPLQFISILYFISHRALQIHCFHVIFIINKFYRQVFLINYSKLTDFERPFSSKSPTLTDAFFLSLKLMGIIYLRCSSMLFN